MRKILLSMLLVSIVTVSAGAAIYSDDFSTNPFTSRWTRDSGGGYPLYWTGENPSSIGSLPAEAGNPLGALYTFSESWKQAWTTDVTPRALSAYTATMDFMINGSSAVSDDAFGMCLQRQADNSNYNTAVTFGGNGMACWYGVYGWSGYYGESIAANEWYQMVTDVAVTASAVTLQSKIVRFSDGAVMTTSPLFTDTSAGRLTDSKGYGIFINCPGTHYWWQALQVDNFNVVPEPMTMALLGLGGLFLAKRRG